MKNPFVIALVSALITAGAIKAAPALAETPSPTLETNVSRVKTADLDLSSKSGQRQLDARIAQAAREVCGNPSDADLAGQNKSRQCRHDAISQATSSRDALLASGNREAVIAVTAAR